MTIDDPLSTTQLNILKKLAAGKRLRMHLNSATWDNGQKCSDEHLYPMEQDGFIVKVGDPGTPQPIVFGWAELTDRGRAALTDAKVD